MPDTAPNGDQDHITDSAATEPKHVNLAGRWRVGHKVGRTIYAQQGPEPSDDDPLIGVMDHPALAALAVECRNRSLAEFADWMRSENGA